MKKVLAIGAHFDDVELAVGGTLNKISKNGGECYKLTLTDNVTLSKHLKLNINYKTSKKSSAEACKILGVKEIQNKKIVKCSKLLYSKEYMQYIEDIIYKKNIDTVFMHYDHDLNQDHIAASEICKTASRHCKNILMFQSNFYLNTKNFSPTLFIDINNEIKNKKNSLKCYEDAHNRYNKLFDLTFKRNEIWGSYFGNGFAEAFIPIKCQYEI